MTKIQNWNFVRKELPSVHYNDFHKYLVHERNSGKKKELGLCEIKKKLKVSDTRNVIIHCNE